VQALLSRYQGDYYQRRLGADRWQALPRWQQVAMLAMIRDLYVPNVGKLGYNLYALPELNCTPPEFVASEALSGSQPLPESPKVLWRPAQADKLWAGATYRLRILNDVWALAYRDPIPGLGIENTTGDARTVVWRVSR
jgi:hypothetical protein